MQQQRPKKRWRLEATSPDQALLGLDKNDPRTTWTALWGFDEDQHTAYQELIEELNKINAPVVIRMVCNN